MEKQILDVKTLGTFKVFRDGRHVRLEPAKHKALIAYLCINKGRAFLRPQLADLLWQSSSEEKAKHSLNQAIYSLRRTLPELIVIERDSIGCNSRLVRTDIEGVLSNLKSGDLTKAFNDMRGAFLEDVDVRNAPDFENWKSNFNRQFYQRNETLVESLIREMPQSRLRHIQVPAHILGRFHSLEQLLVTPKEEIGGRAVTRTNTERPPFTLPFTGRDKHLEQLENSLESCKNGNPAFTVIAGQPGHGKTRLVEEFLLAATGVRTFSVKCYDAERRVGFGPVVDLLAKCLSPADLSTLQPIWLRVLGELAPGKFSDGPPPPQLSAGAGQSRLFEAVLQALICVAEREPLILFVDDVQWADRSTRALFSYLTHRITNSPCMVIAAMRVKSASDAVKAPWNEWDRIDVAELTRAEAAGIVASILPRRVGYGSSSEEIINLTAGHPYLLYEALGRAVAGETSNLRLLETEVVKRVETFVGSLFQSLPRESQDLLAVLSILGRPASPQILRRIANIPDLSQPLDVLVQRGIADVGRDGIALRHDLLREAAYRRIPPFTRTALHRRAAIALKKMTNNAGEAAQHFFKGGLRTPAYEHAITAAEQTDALNAHDESVSFLKLAIRARPSRAPQILPNLAERLYRAHRIREARAALNRAFQANVPRSRELHLLDLELRYSLGEIDGFSLRDEINEHKGSQDYSNTYFMLGLLKLQARSAHHDGDKAASARAVSDLRNFAREIGGSDGLEALAYAARGHSLLVSSIEGEKWIVEALENSDGIPENEAGIRTMGLFGSTMYEVGKLVEAESMHHAALRTAEKIGAINDWPLLGAHAHMLLVEQGKYGPASELALQIRQRVLPGEAAHVLAALAANEAAMYYELRDFDRAETFSAEALQYLKMIQSIWIELEVMGLRGLIFWAQDRRIEARECEEAARTGIERLGYRCGDVSYIEILSSRFENSRGGTDRAIRRLLTAIEDYRERDKMCRLRMELELASLQKTSARVEARARAKTVFAAATQIGARPLAEAADALLLRL